MYKTYENFKITYMDFIFKKKFQISWLLIIFAQNVIYLYIARFLGGLAGGGVFVLIPCYVAEIAEDKIRGTLGTKLVLTCNIGILLCFICGEYLTYRIQNTVYLILPIIFFVGMIFLPETPLFLIKMKRFDEAEKSFKFFRNIKSNPNEKLNESYKMEFQKLKYKGLENSMEFENSPEYAESHRVRISDFSKIQKIKHKKKFLF